MPSTKNSKVILFAALSLLSGVCFSGSVVEPYVKEVFPADIDSNNFIFQEMGSEGQEWLMLRDDQLDYYEPERDKRVPIDSFMLSRRQTLEYYNEKIRAFVAKCNAKLGMNCSTLSFTPVKIDGKLSPAYDTTKFKYIIRHTWGEYSAASTTGVAYYTYRPTFFFYDVREDKCYRIYGLNCGLYPVLYGTESLPVTDALRAMYSFIKNSRTKGYDYAVEVGESKLRRICKKYD